MTSQKNLLKTLLPGLIGLTLAALCSGCPLPSAGYGYGYGAYAYDSATGAYVPPDTTESRISAGPYSGTASGTPLFKGFPLSFEAAWSPNGDQIAVFALPNLEDNFFPRVYLVDATSGKVTASWEIRNPATLLYQESDENPPPALNWSRSGDSLMVLQQSGRRQNIERVYLHRLQAGKPVATQIIHLPLRYNDPGFKGFGQIALSPDHRALALLERRVTSKQAEQLQLQRYDLSSDSLTPLGAALPSSALPAEPPIWSPDMSRILLLYSPPYASSDKAGQAAGRSRLVAVRLSNGQTDSLYEPDQVSLHKARLAPDGREWLAELSSLTPTENLGLSSQQLFPLDNTTNGTPDKAAALLRLNLDTGHRQGFSRQAKNGALFWQGSEQFLAGQPALTNSDSWTLWDLSLQRVTAHYRLPDLAGLKPGRVLASAPYPSRKLAVSLYNPCCILKNLRTGVHLWDLERGTLTRIGPDIATLVNDFPRISLYEKSLYVPGYSNPYSSKDKTP